jgi:hypothetical protein
MTNIGPGTGHKIVLGWRLGTVQSDQTYNVQFKPEKAAPPPTPPLEFPPSELTKTIDAKFLTGFTYGRSYGHHYFVEFAEETAITDRYYASFWYTISAGFGLRWPFHVTGSATIDKVYTEGNPPVVTYPANKLCSGTFYRSKENAKYCAQRATVSLLATPVDGDSAFYAETGLPPEKIFLEEFGATCKFLASIPGPNIHLSCPDSLKQDFGQHYAPQLGPTERDLFNKTFDGRAMGLSIDFGVLYAAFNPGFTVQGKDGRLSFDVKGYSARPSTPVVNLENRKVEFTLTEDNASGPWGFEINNPRYGVNVLIAPSLELELGVGGTIQLEHQIRPVHY